MDRFDLESLTRDELLARARDAGIDGAEWLSREELVAALTRGSSPGRSLGLFDRARALIDRAREIGRSLGRTTPVPPSPASPPAPGTTGTAAAADHDPDSADAPPAARSGAERFETLTMAEVYAAQGLPDEARRIARAILDRDPDNAGARALLARVGEAGHPADAADEPPATYDEDVIGLHLAGADALYAFWEVTLAGRGRAQGLLGEPGRLTLRLVSASATGTSTRDTPIEDQAVGDAFLRDVGADARHRAAVGLVGDGGRFVPIVHSSAAWTPRREPATDTRIEWMDVPPAERSRTVLPPQPTRRTQADVRAQGRAHRLSVEARGPEPRQS